MKFGFTRQSWSQEADSGSLITSPGYDKLGWASVPE
jgi:hypothetical protein